jgi:hypothetical protein
MFGTLSAMEFAVKNPIAGIYFLGFTALEVTGALQARRRAMNPEPAPAKPVKLDGPRNPLKVVGQYAKADGFSRRTKLLRRATVACASVAWAGAFAGLGAMLTGTPLHSGVQLGMTIIDSAYVPTLAAIALSRAAARSEKRLDAFGR